MSNDPKNPPTPTPGLREELEQALEQTEWNALIPHSQRDGIVVVANPLPLVEVGLKIAQDDSVMLERWLQQGLVTKPTPIQLESWNSEPKRKFKILIVQPYVLVQEIIH